MTQAADEATRELAKVLDEPESGVDLVYDPEEPRLVAALEAMRAHAYDPKYNMNEHDIAKVEAMLIGYHVRWLPELPNYEVLGVEVEFYTDLLNPQTGSASKTFSFGGKMDVVLRHVHTSLIWIVEHKTTSEDVGAGSQYWKRIRIDPQVSNYWNGAHALKLEGELGGVLYDVLSKPQERPYKRTAELKFNKNGSLRAGQRLEDETPAEYKKRVMGKMATDPEGWFRREPLVRLEEELDDAQADLWQASQRIIESRKGNRWPRNPDACIRYGQECEYFDVCTRAANINDPFMFYTADEANTELKGDGKKRLPVLSTSAVRSLNNCARAYYYRYEVRRRMLRMSPALAIGSLVHLGLEAWWAYGTTFAA
jgi:hypothetical protein